MCGFPEKNRNKDSGMILANHTHKESVIWCNCNKQSVSKKATLAIFVLFWFWKSDFTFSHVFRNQNFEPVSSSYSKSIHSES